MELVKVPTPSKRNLGAERQTENDLTAPRSTTAHILEGFENGGDCCALRLQKILGLDLPIMHCTHIKGPQYELIGVRKRYGRK